MCVASSMQNRSQEPSAQTGPYPPGADRRHERVASRVLGPSREVLRPLPPELQIVSDAGVSLEQILATVLRAPAGVSPLQALFAEDVIAEEPYYRALAERLGCRYYLGSPPFAEDFDTAKGLRCGVAPLAEGYGAPRAVIAPNPAVTAQLLEETLSGRLRPKSFVVTSPKRFAALVRAQCPKSVLDNALARFPEILSARSGATGAQVRFVGVVAALAAVFSEISVQSLSMITSTALWIVFMASIVLRSLASVANADEKQPRILSDDELPTYTIIAPVYREADIVQQLVDAFDALDYPRSKLDIKLVVERRDRETLSRLVGLDLSARYEVIIAPPGEPSTKPRALNLALAEARGELLVVYDAEDIPAPGQLRLAASRFAADSAVDCLQARLTVRNSDDNWLSRLFSLEYATLFDLINPGLCALGLPIALGGTSNHFRVSALVAVGAWDEWNVAEDADLGIRLARYGYKVGSLELRHDRGGAARVQELVCATRPLAKGWMQTCIVHSRKPILFVRDLGVPRACVVTMLIFGAVVSALLWPVFAVSTIWRAFGPQAGPLSQWREAVDVFVYLLACAGVWAVLIPAIVAARQRRRGWRRDLRAVPLYYVLISLAAWAAILDLILRPHFWAKTEHGRAGRKPRRPGLLRDSRVRRRLKSGC